MPYIPFISRSARRPLRVRFPRGLVAAGGIALAMVAGYVNVILLGFFHVPASHMTGAVSRLGMDVAAQHWLDLWTILGILAGFLGGAMLCGAAIGGTRLRPGRRYGVVLLAEASLLAAAAFMLSTHEPMIGLTLTAMACGVQNAMASSYYGLVVRTTHVTGIVTDLGVMLGHWIRHRRIEPWKLGLLSGLLLGFGAGSMLGAMAAHYLGEWALWPASAGCAVGGLVYLIWHRRSRVVRRLRVRMRERAVSRRTPSTADNIRLHSSEKLPGYSRSAPSSPNALPTSKRPGQ